MRRRQEPNLNRNEEEEEEEEEGEEVEEVEEEGAVGWRMEEDRVGDGGGGAFEGVWLAPKLMKLISMLLLRGATLAAANTASGVPRRLKKKSEQKD